MNKTFWERLQSTTPRFFKGVIKIAGIVAATGIYLASDGAVGDVVGLPVLHLPLIVKQIGGYMIAVGSVAGFIAKLAVVDPNTPAK